MIQLEVNNLVQAKLLLIITIKTVATTILRENCF